LRDCGDFCGIGGDNAGIYNGVMDTDFPNDADGDALRRVAKDGSDMSKSMFIDFQMAIPNEEAATKLALAAKKLGYHAKTYASGKSWTCECSTWMLATYEGVAAVQAELAAQGAPFGGFPDGWGTFGNEPNGQPDAA
jgi:regulator of RNase E activity RraB